jgi:hypothetical protein
MGCSELLLDFSNGQPWNLSLLWKNILLDAASIVNCNEIVSACSLAES